MTFRFGRPGAWAGAVALCLATAAAGEPLPKPPLTPGEAVAVTANGCALIARPGTDPESLRRFRDSIRGSRWSGPCRNGLAHGSGTLTTPAAANATGASMTVEYFYGRPPPGANYGTADGGLTWYRTDDGRMASATSDASLDRPVWGDPNGTSASYVSVGDQSAFTYSGLPWPPDYRNYFAVGRGMSGGETDCPDRNSTVGCEGLWRQIAGPLIATYRGIRAEVEGKLQAWRADLTQLNASRDARFAALETAAGQAFERSLTVVDADAGKADRDFNAKLTTANAGQLYAMADQFERAGDSEKAGVALRALLSRFPDHALAVTAAQHLSALPPPQPTSAPCNAPAQETQASMALRGAMGRIPSSNAAWQYEAVLSTIERSAGAWARCPTHSSSAAKIRNYRAAYLSAAARCAMVSPTGACTPNMH